MPEEMKKDERAQKWYGLVDSTALVYVAMKSGSFRAHLNGRFEDAHRSQLLAICDTYEMALDYAAERFRPCSLPGAIELEGEWIGVTMADVTPMLFWDRTATSSEVADAAFQAKLDAVSLLRKYAAEFGQDPNARGLSAVEVGVASNAIEFASNVINGWARGLKRVDSATGEPAEVTL